MNYSLFFILSLFLYVGCTENTIQSQLDEVYMEANQIHCELSILKDSITKSWDQVNTVLNDKLPTDIPNAEKTNMLKVRNASLIRMFETYHALDDNTKHTVDNAEKTDKAIAQKISFYRKRMVYLENQRQHLIQQSKKSNESINLEDYPSLRDIQPNDC